MLHLLDVQYKGYYTFYCTIRDIFGLVHSLTARPIWLIKLCTRPNIFPYCTVKRLITYNYCQHYIIKNAYSIVDLVFFYGCLFYATLVNIIVYIYINYLTFVLYICFVLNCYQTIACVYLHKLRHGSIMCSVLI